MNLFYLGSDQFSNFALNAIVKKQHLFQSIKVFTKGKVDNTQYILSTSSQNNFEISDDFTNNKISNKQAFQKLYDESNKYQNKLMIACSFGLMVPNNIIDNFQQSCFVVHPSLLPDLRGSSPISGAFLAGLSKTGVSIVEMSKNKYDAGSIYMQEGLEINQQDKYPQLYEKLGNLSDQVLQQFLENYVKGYKFHKIEQQLKKTSYAKKLKQGDNIIQVQQENGKQILRKHKAYYGSTLKGIRLNQGTKQLRIIDCEFIEDSLCNILRLNYDVDRYMEVGDAVQGLGQKKHTLLIKCKDGYLWIKNALYLNRPNLTFTQVYINFISDELKGRLSKKNLKNKEIFKNIKLLKFDQIQSYLIQSLFLYFFEFFKISHQIIIESY